MIFILFEEDTHDNETAESGESDTLDNSETASDSEACTYVYTENFDIVCAESLITSNVTEETEPVQVELVQSEEQIDYDSQVLQLLTDIEQNQQDILLSTDQTAALELYEDIHEELSQVYDYVGLFVGLYFVGWIIRIVNSWRRSND